MRLLIVEDEARLRESLAEQFRTAGFVVDSTGEAEEAIFLGEEYPVDVAVVDLGLPDASGMDVIRTWREQRRGFPVLILTARGRWQDKVAGLEAGADDYLVKPFQPEELAARVNALLRRAAGWATPVLECGDVRLDTAAQRVTVGGRNVNLTAYEYRIIEHLMLHAGQVVSKTELSEHLYPDDDDRDSNVIEVLIGRVRRKLDPDGTRQPLETLRGRGYRFSTGDC
ncbi:MAG TPA: response regulator transcription factor [Gammaproteobacteria bacterium]|nr:response regulator transcription factor [Gammaproteobacteria bacterium]